MLCVVEIAEVLDEHISVISNHLATLRAVGLVTREQYDAFAYYSLHKGALEQYQQFLEQLTASPRGRRRLSVAPLVGAMPPTPFIKTECLVCISHNNRDTCRHDAFYG